MFPHTITLFNVYKKEKTVYYHRTLLTGVFFYKSNQVIDEEHGLKNASKYHCIIPLEQLKNYIDRKCFNNLTDKTNKFTFAPKDIVVFGECEDIKSISELQTSEYDYFMIRTVNDYRYGGEDLQSIEVTS